MLNLSHHDLDGSASTIGQEKQRPPLGTVGVNGGVKNVSLMCKTRLVRSLQMSPKGLAESP